MIDLAALPSVSMQELLALPALPGVYFVLDERNTVMYIGQSFSVRQRLGAHPRKKDFLQFSQGRIAWHLVPYEELSAVEIAMIAFFKPLWNIAKGGNRRPKTKAAVYKPLTLRLPPDLLEVLQRQADAVGRPVNTHIIFVLRYGLGLDTQPASPSPASASPLP